MSADSATATGEQQSDSDAQVLVRFVTSLDDSLRVTDSPFSLPGRLTRLTLSEVINHLLGTAEGRPVPFDFLCGGEFVRTSLLRHLRDRGIPNEGTITIEYTLALGTPGEASRSSHGDWVSCVSCASRGDGTRVLISGGYDRRLKVWDALSGGNLSSHEGHECAVKSLSRAFGVDGGTCVVSSGKDCLVRLWSVGEGGLTCRAVMRGHGDSVDSVCASPDGSRACSASWDATLRIWDLPAALSTQAAEEPPSAKKKAAAGKTRKSAVGGAEVNAVSVLEGHTGAVSCVDWPTHVQLVSGGKDHTIRLWDALTAKSVSTIGSHKAVCCISYSVLSGLCATGHSDGVLRLWDPRTADDGSTAATNKALTAHKGWVSAVDWHEKKPLQLLSASYDGSLKVWDLRSSTPLHTTRAAHGGKVLCARWWVSDSVEEILSGGTDGKVSRRVVPPPGSAASAGQQPGDEVTGSPDPARGEEEDQTTIEKQEEETS